MNYEALKDKNIAVLISGGVDSGVVTHLLCQHGLTPDLYYIKIGMEGEDSSCTAEEDIELCMATAHKYGLKLEVIDLQKEYWERVVGYAIERVRLGLTPNPDVMCNKLIKFGAFEDKVGHRYDKIATGHYATIIEKEVEDAQGHKTVKTYLGTAKDPVKDQTDFLAQLTGLQISKLLCPLGPLMKEEVRHIATQAGLPSAKRKDSQGICFLGKINYNDFLRKYLGTQEGKIIDIETNRILGTHQGFWFHTIGQRKGLGLGGGPWFVVKKDVERNILYVSHGYAPQTAYMQDIPVHDLHWLTLPPKPDSHTPQTEGGLRISFKIRHTPEYLPATLQLLDDGHAIVHADKPVHGVAPGQFCVIYDHEHHRCYGSGEIFYLS